jgi:hypothetical protein
MSLESQLFTLLQGVCPRSFPDFAPATTARPYVTYQQIGGQAVNHLDRLIPNKRNAVMQINVWSDTRAEANTLIQSIEDALRMTTVFQAEPSGAPHASFDADIPVYAAIQDFSIWADR